jgi:hypothetical protein
MGLYKRAHFRGMAHELTRQGIVSWPSKLAEEMAADEIADAMGDEEIPEVSPEGGLSAEEAQDAVNKIVEVAQDIAEKTGGVYDHGVNKEAASMDYAYAASASVISLMEKVAEETAVQTGPDIPGSTPPTPYLGATAEAEVDAATVPSAELVGPQGMSDVDTKPGAVGTEEDRDQPGAVNSPPTGEVAKLSHLLQKMASYEMPLKEAMDGASLSGGYAAGTPPTPRKDLADNLNIPGVVAPGQGKSIQDIPVAAQVGRMSQQPAGTPGVTAPTKTEPAKDALKEAANVLRSTPQGRQFLGKLAEEAAGWEAEERRVAEEQQKEAAVALALRQLANASQAYR